MFPFVNKIKKRLGFYKSKDLINDIIQHGGKVGIKTVFFDPCNTTVDMTRPWLLNIGNYCKITKGCILLTHDYSLSVLRRVYGEWIGEGAETIIGDNCFLGMNSIVLMGSKIGNNVIVAAGSVVRGVIPDNVVVAGNPAKVVCSIEEHYRSRQKKTVVEAKACAMVFMQRFNKKPTPKDLSGFYFLFTPRSKEYVKKYNVSFLCNGDEPRDVENAFYSSSPYWDDFDDFMKECNPNT